MVDETFDDIDQLTGARCPEPLFDPDAPIGSSYPLDADARQYLEGVTEIANELLGFILEDAPELAPAVHPLAYWRDGPALTWHAVDGPSGELVPIKSLSQAQRRWAALAIHAALRSVSPNEYELPAPHSDLAVVLDEPEAALHPAAESHLARGLHNLVMAIGGRAFVATHSRALLNAGADDVRLHCVLRDEAGATSVVPLPDFDDDGAFAVLGLEPADILQLTRLFVLVEGDHDSRVLLTLFRDQFASMRVRVLPLRGARNLPQVVNTLVFSYTSASFLVVLDGISRERARVAWSEARDALDAGDMSKAAALLSDHFSGKRAAEEKWLKDFLTDVIKGGHSHRVEVSTLERGDIIEYLDVESLVAPATSWAALRAEYDEQNPKDPRPNFKRWLLKAYQADVSAERIQAAAETLDAIPDDFIVLLADVESAVSRVRSRSRLER